MNIQTNSIFSIFHEKKIIILMKMRHSGGKVNWKNQFFVFWLNLILSGDSEKNDEIEQNS